MGINCLDCINSACCKLDIEISQDEYNNLSELVKREFIKRSDEFLLKNPKFKSKIEYLDEMYSFNFAIMKKNVNGFCNLLDDKTKLCSVYENRPNACRKYELSRCEKIRLIK